MNEYEKICTSIIYMLMVRNNQKHTKKCLLLFGWSLMFKRLIFINKKTVIIKSANKFWYFNKSKYCSRQETRPFFFAK